MKKIAIIGFVRAPAWLDPAPSAFPIVVNAAVHTRQALLLRPEFDYHLETVVPV